MPTVISDSSTLIHLGGIGRLALLRELYGQIIIPPAVWREVVEEGKGRAGAAEVETAQKSGWIVLLPPTNEPLAFSLKRDLDEGEAEAIALALEHQADLILLDESDARSLASRYSLKKTGAIGVLMRAKKEGKVASLRAELDRLRNQSGFWIEDRLYQRVLTDAGETAEGDG